MNGTESHIRQALEGSLRRLGLKRIDLYQLHRVDPSTPIEETMRVFRALRDEGLVRYIGLSEVSIEEIERARAVVEIATVQNIYNLALRKHDDVLAYCESNGIGFIPFWPLHSEHSPNRRNVRDSCTHCLDAGTDRAGLAAEEIFCDHPHSGNNLHRTS